MSRRSRRNQGVAITLFSFQDVMMTVMGILILITLMMSLDLTDAVAQRTPAASASPQTPLPDVKALQQQLARLQDRYDEAQEQATRLAEISQTGPAQFKKLKQQLEQHYGQIDHLRRRIEKMKKQLPAKVDAVEQTKHSEDQTRQLEAQAARLREQIRQQQQNPRLSYILQPGQAKQPILCVISDQRIGIGSVDAAAPALWLTQQDNDDQLAALRRTLDRFNSDRQYVVVLLKPSGFDQRYEPVRAAIKAAGFQAGLDLIDEDTHVLPGGN